MDKNKILESIALSGAASEENQSTSHKIGLTPASVIDFSAGLPRARGDWKLILAQPLTLSILSPLAIKCCICGRTIHYPVWYQVKGYNINTFHYFLCFANSDRPKVSCYRGMK